jgi:site-specific DNA recombinase
MTPTRNVESESASGGRKLALTYARVSTTRQAERDIDEDGFSLPAQLEACRAKAALIDADVVHEFVDRGESARFADRPELQRMLAYIEEHRNVSYVIVHKVNRFARNTEDAVLLRMRLSRAGAELVSAAENIDDSPAGRLMRALLEGMAEYESANLARDVRIGMTKKAQKGGTPSMAPLGYLNIRQSVDGEREVAGVAVDPERAPLVQRCFELYATGEYTLSALLAQLTGEGLTTRATRKRPEKPLSKAQLARILRNRYYLGLVCYSGGIYEGRHEALVDHDTFDRVSAVLAAHQRSGEKARERKHYLKGSVYCGKCGRRLGFTNSRGKMGEYYQYWFCFGRQRKEGCTQTFMPNDAVERAIENYYDVVALPASQLDDIQQTLTQAFKTEHDQADRIRNRTNQRLARLDDQRRRLMQALYADAVPLDLFKAEQDRIRQEERQLKMHLEAIDADFDAIKANLERALELARNAADAYRAAPPALRRQWNQLLFTHLYVDDNQVVGSELTPPFAALLADDLIETINAELDQTPPDETFDDDQFSFAQSSNMTHLVGRQGLEP